MEKPSFVFSALSYTIHPEESQVLFAIFLEIRNLPPDGTFPERRYPGKRAAKKAGKKEKKALDRKRLACYNTSCSAGVAHLVERHLAKVEVAGSSPVARSKKDRFGRSFLFRMSTAVRRFRFF